MSLVLINLLIFAGIILLDCLAYNFAKGPGKGKLRYMLPLGGFVALYIHGRKE